MTGSYVTPVEEHGTLITIMLVIMFIITMVYAGWVMVLDYREQREHEADTMRDELTSREDDA